MNVLIKYGTENIDWESVCEIIRLAPLGTRDPGKLKIAAENSHTVCTAYADEQLVGFGRAISDGQFQSAIYDVVVLPEFQSQGVGQSIMNAILEKLPNSGPVLLYAAPGKQAFYRKFGFGVLKTGMALFPDPERYRSKGYLE
jgi:ribosomal protein S18 acetylase RimI-like enzyme